LGSIIGTAIVGTVIKWYYFVKKMRELFERRNLLQPEVLNSFQSAKIIIFTLVLAATIDSCSQNRYFYPKIG
jgi:hypothetical protein